MTVPVLETTRLILRPLKLTDVDAYYSYFNEWEIIRYLSKHVPWPYTREAATYFISNAISSDTKELVWAITKKDRASHADELIGVIELYPHQQDSHRGFWIGLPFQKQGLMTEAANVVTDYWFDILGKQTMRLRNEISNDASRRIKEKLNARLIGTEQKQYADPAFTTAEIWEITAEEWQQYRQFR